MLGHPCNMNNIKCEYSLFYTGNHHLYWGLVTSGVQINSLHTRASQSISIFMSSICMAHGCASRWDGLFSHPLSRPTWRGKTGNIMDGKNFNLKKVIVTPTWFFFKINQSTRLADRWFWPVDLKFKSIGWVDQSKKLHFKKIEFF